jgi:protein-tyrosine-phosphatase
MSDKKRVLILCIGNSARGQMAEELLRHDADDRFDVESAGTKPSVVVQKQFRLCERLA